MKLTQTEFNKRCHEVFYTETTDKFYFIEVDDDGVRIEMSERSDGEDVVFTYEPDMTERPESLDYLLGNRNDFND